MTTFFFQAASATTLENELLEQDFQKSYQVETVRLGTKCLYYPGVIKRRYLPYETIRWAYLRAEENRMSVCCGRVIVDIWYLLLHVAGDQVIKIEFQKKESAKEALTLLAEKNPNILIGYSEENKKQLLG